MQTPAFSAAHIRTLTPVFYDKATEVRIYVSFLCYIHPVQLRDIWLAILDATDPSSGPVESKRIDVLAWLGRAMLDVIEITQTQTQLPLYMPTQTPRRAACTSTGSCGRRCACMRP